MLWDQNNTIIHSSPTLPHNKYKYLLTYLAGPAKDTINGIRLAYDNYDFPIKVITNHFRHKDLLVGNHLDELLALEPVQRSADIDKLRVLYDRVTFRVICWRAWGSPQTSTPSCFIASCYRPLHTIWASYTSKSRESQQDAFEVSTSPATRSQEIKAILNFLRVQVGIREEIQSDRPEPFSRYAQEERQSSPLRFSPPIGNDFRHTTSAFGAA